MHTEQKSYPLITGLLALLLASLFSTTLNAQDYRLERVEPLHWWTEMNNPQLQLLLYGSDISNLLPEITYPGVEIQRVERTENENYLFLYLSISTDAQPGRFDILLKQDEKTVIAHEYELKEREENSQNRRGFDASDVIYLITPDRFANGDTGNDSVVGYADTLDRSDDYARHGGDIQGIIDHLNYIDEMGFTAIWLNPVLENAMPEQSYHGYATTDYYKVDPRIGSNSLYRKLSREAAKRGIKLIKDIITNHAGSRHWWMDDPPSSDWFHYQQDYRVTNHRRTTLHDPYASDIDTRRFTDGWFVSAMPDLNQDNPLLANYLVYNSIWWIEFAGLHGIRHDTHPYAGPEFLEQWTCRIIEEYPHFNIVGEEWAVTPVTLAKWQNGSKKPADFGSCLPSLMDFPLQSALSAALREKESWGSGFVDLYETLSYDFLYANPMNLVLFPDNHDMDRFFRQVGQDIDLFKMGMAYVLTMRGIPQIFYGTEILMSNENPHDHGEIRTDFPGGWPADSINAFTGQGLSDRQKEMQSYMKKLLNWRKDNPVIHRGKLMHYAPKHDGLYVYFRYDDQKRVMVAFNKNEKALELDRDYFSEMMGGFSYGKDVMKDKNYSLDSLKVPGRSVLILELQLSRLD